MQTNPHMATSTAIPAGAGQPPAEYMTIMKKINAQRDDVLLAIMISPDTARLILKNHNIKNRSINKSKLTDYVAEIRDGRWRVNGEFMTFSETGALLNGQHRLRACIIANRSFVTDIRFNLEDDVFDVIDRGRPRDGGDILTIAGYQNGARLNRAIRWAYTIEQGKATHTGGGIQPEDVLDLIRNNYPTIEAFIGDGQAIYKISGQPEGQVAGFIYMCYRANPTKAHEFISAWKNNQWGGKYGAIGVMEKTVGLMKKAQLNPTGPHRLYMMITCWNNFLHGRMGSLSHYRDWNGVMPQLLKR